MRSAPKRINCAEKSYGRHLPSAKIGTAILTVMNVLSIAGFS